MRDQAELAKECLAAEERGEDVIEYLKNRGFVSPRATWERLQINELGRWVKNYKGVVVVMEQKVTKAQKDTAVQIAMKGGDPIAYLMDCGSKAPSAMWLKLRDNLKKQDPEMYAQLMENYKPRSGKLKAEPAEAVAEAPVTGKKPKITSPLTHSELDAIGWKGKSGKFFWDPDREYFDYDNGSDELTMTLDELKTFLRELVSASSLCGLDLGVDIRD